MTATATKTASQRRIGSVNGSIILLLWSAVAALSAGCAAGAAAGCGADFTGQWEAKVQTQQVSPTPDDGVACCLGQTWTYMLLDIVANQDYMTISFTSYKDTAVMQTCNYYCASEEMVSHIDTRFQINQVDWESGIRGKTDLNTCPSVPSNAGSSSSGADTGDCGVDCSNLAVNDELLSICDNTEELNSGQAFDILIKPLEHKVGTWTHNVSFIASSIVGQSPHYITCDEGANTVYGYKLQGSIRPYVPWAPGGGWAFRPGSIILYICTALFAIGWLYLFWNIRGPSEKPEEDISDQEQYSGEESGSETESETGSEEGSESEEEGEEEEEEEEEGDADTLDDAGTFTTDVTSVSGNTGAAAGAVGAGAGMARMMCSQCNNSSIADQNARFCPDCGGTLVLLTA